MADEFGPALDKMLRDKWKSKAEIGNTDVSGNLQDVAEAIHDYAHENLSMASEQSAALRSDAITLQRTHTELNNRFGPDYTDPKNKDAGAILEIVIGVSDALKSNDVKSLLARVFINKAAK